MAGKRADTTVEVTTYRSENYLLDSRNPEVEYGKDILGDLSRRDFTVNSMALELTGVSPQFLDPFNGLQDLAKKLLNFILFILLIILSKSIIFLSNKMFDTIYFSMNLSVTIKPSF